MYKKLFLNILVILLISAVIIILINLFWKLQPNHKLDTAYKKTNNNQASYSQTIEEENNLPPRPKVPEPENVNKHEGVIVSIEEGTITLATIFGEKVVEFDNNTTWQKIFLPKFPPIPGRVNNTPDLPDPEKLSSTDFAVGQEVEVTTDLNISGQNKFVAKEINLIERFN